MARKSKGFIELEWTCPNCETRNKGFEKTCMNCGAPQPDDVQFEAPSEKKFVSDEKASELRKRGADIHCGFCGTRNPSTAETCSQCGGDLAEGTSPPGRARNRHVGQEAPEKLTCSNCETENPGTNTNCQECGAPLPRPAAQTPAAVPMSFATPGAAPAEGRPRRNPTGCSWAGSVARWRFAA